MPTIQERFGKLFRQETGYHPNFPLGIPLGVGAIVKVDGGELVRVGSISDYGMDILIERGDPLTYDFASEGLTQVNFKIEGGAKIPVQALGGLAPTVDVEVGFVAKREFSFRFAADGESLESLRTDIGMATRLKAAGWQPEWRLVVAIIRAKSYSAQGVRKKGDSFNLSGKVEAVQAALDAGLMLGVQVSNSAQFNVKGTDAVVGLDLYAIGPKGFKQV